MPSPSTPAALTKLTFEHVSAVRYPRFYRNERPIVAASAVPDECWTVTERVGDGIWRQYQGLRQLQRAGELIRNVRVYEAPLVWHEVTEGPRASVAGPDGLRLSPRELNALRLIAEGHEQQRVADDLGLPLDTVKGHLRSVRSRLGARNSAHAVAIVCHAGLIEPPESLPKIEVA